MVNVVQRTLIHPFHFKWLIGLEAIAISLLLLFAIAFKRKIEHIFAIPTAGRAITEERTIEKRIYESMYIVFTTLIII